MNCRTGSVGRFAVADPSGAICEDGPLDGGSALPLVQRTELQLSGRTGLDLWGKWPHTVASSSSLGEEDRIK